MAKNNAVPNGGPNNQVPNENGDGVARGNDNGRNTEGVARGNNNGGNTATQTAGMALINAAYDGERVKVFGAMIKNTTTTISAGEAAHKLMERDNQPNRHCYKDDGTFIVPRGDLPEDEWLPAGRAYANYMKPKTRIYKQVASLKTIERCKYRWGATRYHSPDSEFNKEHMAIYLYGQSSPLVLKNENGEFINYHETATLTYVYYRPIAGVENVSSKEAASSTLFEKASTRLRTLKVKMLALIIRRMGKGFKLNKTAKGRGGPQNKLSWFEEDDPQFYNLHVLPLAQTATYMMDNEHESNLSVNEIVEVNVDSFSRDCVKLMKRFGIWSVNHLRTMKDDELSEAKKAEYSYGLEFTVARIFCMLHKGAALPEPSKWHITNEEKSIIFGRDLIIISQEDGYPALVPLV